MTFIVMNKEPISEFSLNIIFTQSTHILIRERLIPEQPAQLCKRGLRSHIMPADAPRLSQPVAPRVRLQRHAAVRAPAHDKDDNLLQAHLFKGVEEGAVSGDVSDAERLEDNPLHAGANERAKN